MPAALTEIADGFDTVRSIVAARAWSGRSGGIPLRAATSIVATVHWTDRSFRLRKPPTEFPPLEALGGIPLRAATDMVATPHCGARFLSVEKGFDEISATGGHRILSPRPFQVHGFKSPSFRIAEIRSTRKGHFGFLCRSGGIRTRGLLVPNQTRYQTALHLVTGADEGTRTPDLLITNRLLYQLSHIGTTSDGYYIKAFLVCPALFSYRKNMGCRPVFLYSPSSSKSRYFIMIYPVCPLIST